MVPLEISCPPRESNGVINGERTNIDSIKCKGIWEFTHQSLDYTCLSRWMDFFYNPFQLGLLLAAQETGGGHQWSLQVSRCSRLFLKDKISNFWNELDALKARHVFQFEIRTGGAAWTSQWVICLMVFLGQLSIKWLQNSASITQTIEAQRQEHPLASEP